MKVYYQDNKFFMEDGEMTVEVFTQGECLKLPANSCNRVWVSPKKVMKTGVIDYGTEVKVARTNITVTPRKPDIEYLNEDEAKLYQELMAKIKERREAERAEKHKPMTALEKAQRKADRANAEVEALKAQQGGNN